MSPLVKLALELRLLAEECLVASGLTPRAAKLKQAQNVRAHEEKRIRENRGSIMNQTPHCPHCGFGESQDVEDICAICAEECRVNHATFNEWLSAAEGHGFADSRDVAYDLWISGTDPKHEGEQYHRPGAGA